MKHLTRILGLLVLASGCATTPQPVAFKTAVSPAENAAKGNFTVIELRYANASELRDLLVQLMQSYDRQLARDAGAQAQSSQAQGAVTRPPPAIVADVRTNSLIISSFDDADLVAVRELIARLDVEVGPAKK